MIILTTTYNCENYIDLCLNSLMRQSFKNFKCYITDDMSTDGTLDKIKNKINGDDRFVLIQNTEKLFQPGNYDQVLRDNNNIDDWEVCVEVDGDDWLPDEFVLDRVNSLYNNKKIWLANGSFIYSDGRSGFAKPYSSFDNIRDEVFTLTHLRTWRVFLWRNILQQDLKDENGSYWSVSGDLSFMYPMAEMCGIEHYRFMKDINYIYNEHNPLNDHKINLGLVSTTTQKIRRMSPYTKLIL
jgi:glycosyltransferase involved in cell wall biosynthesis